MRIGICDDEKEIRNHIERSVLLFYEDMEIYQFEDGKALLDFDGKLDILFLDIQMADINGIEVARRLRKAENNVTIIFVTAMEEYVFQAFDVKAFHYLVKPMEQAKFYEVLKAAVEERRKINVTELKEEPGIAIKKGTVTRKIYLKEIYYLEVCNRTVMVHTLNGDIEFYGKLKTLEECLSGEFFRCHRAFIVNLRYVLKYDANVITLENGKEVLLAKQKYPEFVQHYLNYTRSLIES